MDLYRTGGHPGSHFSITFIFSAPGSVCLCPINIALTLGRCLVNIRKQSIIEAGPTPTIVYP